jgi:hypothetical protein
MLNSWPEPGHKLVDSLAVLRYNLHMNKQRTPNTPQTKLVKDRKTGEYYDPKARFDELMNKPEIMASLNRLKIR